MTIPGFTLNIFIRKQLDAKNRLNPTIASLGVTVVGKIKLKNYVFETYKNNGNAVTRWPAKHKFIMNGGTESESKY